MPSRTVLKPWGSYKVIGQWSGKITVKILRVNPDSRLSLQRHGRRDEEWLCLSGRALAQIGTRSVVMKAGDKVFVPRKSRHRLASKAGAELLEVSYGDFDENDIERFEDDYGRA